MQHELSQEEDNELTAFLGMYAKAMSGPLREDEEKCDEEPDPSPPDCKHASSVKEQNVPNASKRSGRRRSRQTSDISGMFDCK